MDKRTEAAVFRGVAAFFQIGIIFFVFYASIQENDDRLFGATLWLILMALSSFFTSNGRHFNWADLFLVIGYFWTIPITIAYGYFLESSEHATFFILLSAFVVFVGTFFVGLLGPMNIKINH